MSFLQQVAQHYARLAGTAEWQKTVFVFPNRRAGLFFLKYLAQEVGKPVFSPSVITISQLFESLSAYEKADPVDLLFRLYHIYNEVYLDPAGREESFDDFLFWGRMMLADFNEVDQNRVDASRLFSNLADMKDIDLRFADLDAETHTSIQTFLSGFQQQHHSSSREKFNHIWRSMLPIYTRLREELQKEGIAYPGMLCREVVEQINTISVPDKKYVFVGFNALTETEKQLMLALRDLSRAAFLWDYSHPWIADPQNRASLFREENLQLFLPEWMPPEDDDKHIPNIHLLQVPSLTGQTKEITKILANLKPADWTKTGIVLPDESLLPALLNSIPENVENVNITMGLPLRSTPVIPLLQHLSELQLMAQKKTDAVLFYYKPVLALLAHPYLKANPEALNWAEKIRKNNLTYVPLSLFEQTDLFGRLFRYYDHPQKAIEGVRELLYMLVVDDDEDLSLENQQRNEYIYQTLTAVNRLAQLLEAHPAVCPSVKTLFALLTGVVAEMIVPFEGEPLAGLQIMGMLESRSMAFDTLILTDVNDDVLPGKVSAHSFIPYDLRHAFRLPTPERQDAVYAYNFYRLIKEASEVWLLQNTVADDKRSGEVSRFVSQLQYQYAVPVHLLTETASAETLSPQLLSIPKTDEVLRELAERFCPAEQDTSGKGLSATALNTYVACPLRFYLQYVRGYNEADTIEEDIAANIFGTVVHETMRSLYQDYCGKTVTASVVEALLQRVRQTDLVEKQYRRHFFKNEDALLEGKDMLPLHVVVRYVEKILLHDKALTPFRYLASEQSCQRRLPVEKVGGSDAFRRYARQPLLLKGVIDRVDKVGDKVRVVDYKTGKEHSVFPLMADLYAAETGNSDHVRQTLLYCFVYEALLQTAAFTSADAVGKADFFPYIYYIKNEPKKFEHEIADAPNGWVGYRSMKEAFEEVLCKVLQEITDDTTPFAARPDKNEEFGNKCKYCPFRSFCN